MFPRSHQAPRIVEPEAKKPRPMVASLDTATTGGPVSFPELRKLVTALLRKWQHGKPFHNAPLGIDIAIAGNAVTKFSRVSEPLLRAHYALPQILEKGILLSREEPKVYRPGLLEVLRLSAFITLNDEIFHVVVIIQHYENGHYYSMDTGMLVVGTTPSAFNPTEG